MPGFHGGDVVSGRKSIAGSGIGSLAETKEMLEFCVEHNIYPDTELIPIGEINNVWKSMKEGQSHRRYVIDIANTLN
jgi:uncharacterized zinc-type alcohol dehydrogenase-like protein